MSKISGKLFGTLAAAALLANAVDAKTLRAEQADLGLILNSAELADGDVVELPVLRNQNTGNVTYYNMPSVPVEKSLTIRGIPDEDGTLPRVRDRAAFSADLTVENVYWLARAEPAGSAAARIGGAIYFQGAGETPAPARLVLNDCVFDSSQGGDTTIKRGSLVYAGTNATVIAARTTFKNGRISNENGSVEKELNGGAVYLEEHSAGSTGASEFTDCIFIGNSTPANQNYASGMAVNMAANARFVRCEFSDNTGSCNGGAVAIRGGSEDMQVTFSQCEFLRNACNWYDSKGAVADISAKGTVRFEDCTFRRNHGKFAERDASNKIIGYSDRSGYAIHLRNPEGRLEVARCTIDLTRTAEDTQCVEYKDYFGGGAAIASDGDLLLEDSVLFGASYSNGVRAVVSASAMAAIRRCHFRDNFIYSQSSFGAGVVQVTGNGGSEMMEVLLRDCTFSDNETRGNPDGKRPQGTCISCVSNNKRITVENCTFFRNKAQNNGSVAGWPSGGYSGNLIMNFCTMKDNRVPAGCSHVYCPITGSYSGIENISFHAYGCVFANELDEGSNEVCLDGWKNRESRASVSNCWLTVTSGCADVMPEENFQGNRHGGEAGWSVAELGLAAALGDNNGFAIAGGEILPTIALDKTSPLRRAIPALAGVDADARGKPRGATPSGKCSIGAYEYLAPAGFAIVIR